MKLFFPGGKDPNLRLIHVRADSAEYWDGPGTLLGKALNFVLSAVQDEPAQLADNGFIDLGDDRCPVRECRPLPADLETWQPASGQLYRVPAQNQRWNRSTVAAIQLNSPQSVMPVVRIGSAGRRGSADLERGSRPAAGSTGFRPEPTLNRSTVAAIQLNSPSR